MARRLIKTIGFLFIWFAVTRFSPAQDKSRDFVTGVDANYALDMESRGASWKIANQSTDLFKILTNAGCNGFRVRLWTGDHGMNGLDYALESTQRASVAGLKPYLVLFLSENWSDMVKQPVPMMWKDLSDAEKLKAIEAYTARVTKRFTDHGFNVDWFEIGNEIDFGICGVFEEEWPKRVSIDYMRARIWPRMVPIIKAAQTGVKSVRPEAKFILHLAQWNSPDYCAAFWQFMIDNGVTVDLLGLSYFPTSVETKDNSLATFGERIKAIHEQVKKPILICEYGYPSADNFGGQFASWNKPVTGYTLDPSGQHRWLTDFLATARANPNLAGAFYWSPEWCDGNLWDAFALFDDQHRPRPALNAFK